MASSCYVIPNDLYSDLMYFSDWQWLLFAVFRKSQPPWFILLFNSMECSLYLTPSFHCSPLLPFFFFPRFLPHETWMWITIHAIKQNKCLLFLCMFWHLQAEHPASDWGWSCKPHRNVCFFAMKHNYHTFAASQYLYQWLCPATTNISVN